MIQVPLTNDPNQSFSITIPVGSLNIALDLFAWWNRIAGYWELNITSTETKQRLLSNLPLLTSGKPPTNLLKQYSYLGIGSAYVLPLSTATTENPGITDWGSNFILLWAS